MGVRADLAALRKAAGTDAKGTSMEGLKRAAESLGLKARGVQVNRAALRALESLAVAHVNGDHYVALLHVEGETVRIHDPERVNEETIPTEELLRHGGGILLIVTRR